MSFDLCNCPLKIWKSIGTPIPKVEVHLGVWGFIPSHYPTLTKTWNWIPELHFWLTPLQAFALVMSSGLGLQQIYIQQHACNTMFTSVTFYNNNIAIIINNSVIKHVVNNKMTNLIWQNNIDNTINLNIEK
jgi:hypothetical protein